jgi:hypothetical protein
MPDVKGLARDKITASDRFDGEGNGFLTVALPSIGAALDKGLRDGVFACPSGFAKIRKGALPKFLSGLLCNIFEPSTGNLKECPSDEAIKAVREAVFLFKKFVYSQRREEILHRAAVDKFWSVDESADFLCQEERKRFILQRVCSFIFRRDLDSTRFDRVKYRHGPGAVAENVKGNQKWSLLCQSFDNFDSGLTGHSLHIVRSEDELVYESMFTLSKCLPSKIAKLITVVKNSSSRRTITAEPLVNQFVQQGLKDVLRQAIDDCPVLSQCIAITDQTKNQVLAMEGSLTGEWATIDLSAASDRLGLKLVEFVFCRHPRFLQAMIDCRSPSCKSDNVTRSMKKFAGMGNALTFPVQSVVFASICIAAELDQLGLYPTYRNVMRLARNIRVYGDDIIVKTVYYDRVVEWIHAFGLKVNVDKSFGTGKFRESCGVDAFNGVDVTPLYLRKFSTQASTADELAHLTSLSNHMWLRGLYEPATWLANIVEGELKTRLPLVSSHSGSLGWHTHLEASDVHRWNKKLHRFETRSYVPRSNKLSDRLDGYPALMKFFHTSLIERGKEHLLQSVRRYSVSLKRRWFDINRVESSRPH